MTTKRIGVTDHALIRYIERVKGIDLDDVRATIVDHVRAAGSKATRRCWRR